MKCKSCGARFEKKDKFCPKCGKKRNNGRTWAAAAAIGATVLIGAAVAVSGSMGGQDNIASAPQTVTTQPAESTTSATTAATTTTTEKTTTQKTTQTTAADTSDELRALLTSKRWSTKVMGFNAEISFNKDGSAQVILNMLFVRETLPARYTLDGSNKFGLEFSYNGEDYSIVGTVKRVSDEKLLINVGSSEYTLTAID